MQFYKKGVIAGLLSLLGFVVTSTILFGTIMTLTDISDEIVRIAGTLILSVGCFIASYVSTQIIRNNGILQGLIICGIVSSVLLVISLIVNSTLTITCFEKIVCCTLLSMIGGIKGINTRKTGK
ncbi:MAG: TIGR04086 family membrane protein [Oscillospiraceae bacterium]|nr:TIGR04086 family membrane protein [Oscillospiraceae bacterium]